MLSVQHDNVMIVQGYDMLCMWWRTYQFSPEWSSRSLEQTLGGLEIHTVCSLGTRALGIQCVVVKETGCKTKLKILKPITGPIL